MFDMLVDAGTREGLPPAFGVSNLDYCVYKIQPMSSATDTLAVAHGRIGELHTASRQPYGS
ncbi:hypothetical protein [Rhodococcus erythropolis]|uniref:Uncharacterized protein n=1 Tax=Rhodococcus erythropolis TaxID=1833 RepID=A0AAX4A0G2_RHOER|nr:hypothetical protein [Rhodococcus erythropolis]WMN03135.1 hypothetical protein QIE55_32545 [Rhodococcus erythropolis]WMN03240.1 hypothetical protein QIE55_33195 [Rhodococcus erythropolis]